MSDIIPPLPETPPEVLITPQQQYDIVSAHRARPPETAVTRSSVISTVKDVLNNATLNGWPMAFDGSSITVSTEAMSPAPSATPRAGGTVQAPSAPQFKVSIMPPPVRVATAPEAVATNATAPQAAIAAPPQVPEAAAVSAPVGAGPVSGASGEPAVKAVAPPASGLTVSSGMDSAYHQMSAVSHSHKKGADPTVGKRDPHHPHDSTMTGETLIPLRLRRADGQRTVLAFIDAPTSYVLEGAVDGERVLATPDLDKFYDAGGEGSLPFAPYDASDGSAKVAISSENSTCADLDLFTALTVDGLDAGFAVAIGDKIYLTFTFTDPVTLDGNPTLAHGSGGWTGYPNPIHIDSSDPANPFQDKFYLMLATCVDPADGRAGVIIGAVGSQVKIVQLQQAALRLKAIANNGVGCIVTENWHTLASDE